MIGVDTNVLLRFALSDDPIQSPAAVGFLLGDERPGEPALICPIALVECVWTLMRRYRFSKPRVIEILDAFTQSSRIAYSDAELVESCIDQWRDGAADLADYLIAALNLQAGVTTTMTFDKTAAQESGFSLLPS